jgi:hypothetical protein
VCSVYDVNEREKNEENKEKMENRKNVYFVCCSKGAVLALFREAFVNNYVEIILEAKDGKYLYTY